MDSSRVAGGKVFRDWGLGPFYVGATYLLLEQTFLQDPTMMICIDMIENHDCIIVVDGSYIPGTGVATASWVLARNEGPVQALGYSRLPGGDNDNDPYRGERYGLCLGLTFLQVLHQHHPQLSGEVTISCDNDEALRRGIEFNLWPKTQSSHFDMLATLHHLRKSLPLRFIPKRVKGHQDSKSNEPLTRLEELNVIADDAARTLAYQIERRRNIQQDLPSHRYQWQIMINNKVIKKKVRTEIQEYVHGQQLKDHWIGKGRFTKDNIDFVDWTALRQAVKRKPQHHQRWATKFISGFCGSYYKLHQIGKHDTPLCPRCGLFDETTEHILYCPHIKSQENRTEALTALDR